MTLTRAQRKSLADSDFAVPGKRALPIHDARHVQMAWSQVMKAGALTDAERAEARTRIQAKGASLGIEIKDELRAASQGLYVRRNLLPASADALRAWALEAGFVDVVPASEMHVTIVRSRYWPPLVPEADELIAEDRNRGVDMFGAGVIVLTFESQDLHLRWQAAADLGATWDHDGYRPHITITRNVGDFTDFAGVKPYLGELAFGPEVFEPLFEGDFARDRGVRMEAAACEAFVDMDAMALEMPDVPGHPNRMPFSGILTRLDTPSDRAPGGSEGKKVIFKKSAAERALPSLIGMAVDFTPDFDGHDAVRKFGVITAANIEGDAIHVGGHIYSRDFPKEASRVRTDKALLGMSWELADIYVESPTADPLVITDAYFTGAAILRKDKAAYQSTSLAASAEDQDMTKEELAAAVGEAIAPAMQPLTEALAVMAAASAKQAELLTALQASAAKDEAAAADAAAKAAEAGKADELQALKTKVADLEAAAAKGGKEPERKTVSPAITALLAKADLALPTGDAKLSVGAVDQALSKAGIEPSRRMHIKAELSRAGALG